MAISSSLGMLPGLMVLQTDQRDGHAARSACQCEHDRLREELPNQPPTARAKRRSNRDFLFSPRGPRKQQVRHVGAGDQQHQPDRAEQHHHDAPQIPHHLIDQ